LNPRIQVSETDSKSQLLPNDEIGEIEVEEFSKLLRTHFGIFCEPVPGRAYALRFTGSPYDHSNEDCRSLQVIPHAKGTILSPLCVLSILVKFDIPVATYCDARSSQGKLFKMKPHAARGPASESGESAV
jgi:hypothetical protein